MKFKSTSRMAIAAMIAFVFSTSPLLAQIDGTRNSIGDNYGLPVFVQTVQTEFGDSNPPAGGSELDAVYAWNDSDNLYLMFTGNLESNFNKFNVFIDSVAGGENVITTDTANGGSNPANDGWADSHEGMTFDTGFEADFMVICRNGDAGGPRFDLDFSSVGNDSVVVTALDVFGGTAEGSDGMLPNGIVIGFDNSNIDGIAGGTGPANNGAASAVMTGIELKIPLSEIGASVNDTIKISAMINGSNHDFLSNQFMAGLDAPQGNLGGDGAGGFIGDLSGINLNDFTGDQFFEVTILDTTTVDVVPTAFALTRGDYISGDLAELAASDNAKFVGSRRQTVLQPLIWLEVSAVSPTTAPTALSFTLEASVFARSGVDQQIELFDYDTSTWEEVDFRPASRVGDLVTVATPTGDLSRFVNPTNGMMEARVRFQANQLRANYNANIDQTIWTITN